MGTDNTRIAFEIQLEDQLNANDELINEVEVVTADDDEPAASEDIPLPTAVPTSTSVATSTRSEYHNQLALLVREVRSLKERLADLMKRVQERLTREELSTTLASAANELVDLEEVNIPPVSSGNLHPSRNSAVKRKSTKSKYAKKRRTMIPGGVTRSPRSLNVKPTTTTVGNLDLATAAYEDDDDFD